jgi:Ca-activated chloride channel family protein
MHRLVLTVALFVAMFAVGMSGQQQPPVFRAEGQTVPVFVTVTDRSDRLVTNLAREDFEVRDNGRVQPISVFDNSPQPIRLIVMIDVSGSMAGNIAILRGAAEELFERLGPDDLVRVGTFGRDIDITPTFTRDLSELRAAIPASIPESAATPLWKALDQAIGELADVDGRPVILVLSDGKDSMMPVIGRKFVTQLEVTEHAQREEVMIYSIGLRSRPTRPRIGLGGGDLGAMMAADLPDPGLGTVALETGGGYFELRPRDELGATFARVADELHSQYLVGFTPAARDGKRHRIEVRVKDRDLKPRARKNYTAPEE